MYDQKKQSQVPHDPYASYESFVTMNRERLSKEKERRIVVSGTPKRKRSARTYIILSAWIFFLVLLSSGAYFVLKIGFIGRQINIDNNGPSVIRNVSSLFSSLVPTERAPLRGEESGRINILLLGKAGEGNPGKNLTDTIMILSIHTTDKKIALLSLPRDFYAPISGTDYSTKLNSIYQYGLQNSENEEPIKKTIEDITGLPIHYFIVLDFDGFKKIIDDLGGINVTVERDIFDARFPGPNYSYETFEIKKGTHLMNGETALKYVRERHDDPEGDFGRAKRQQSVMQSAKNKAFSIQTVLNPFTLNTLLDDLGDNLKTDIHLDEIKGFLELSKETDTQNIATAVVDAWEKDSILKVSHVTASGVRAFVLVPRVGNYSEIRDLAEHIFDREVIRRRKAEIEKEQARVAIINQSSYKNLDTKVKDVLEHKIGAAEVSIVSRAHSSPQKQTFVYDNTNGQKIFTLDEIIKKIGATLNESPSAILEKQKADLVLVLGDDLEAIGLFDEDTAEEYRQAEEKQEYFNLIKH